MLSEIGATRLKDLEVFAEVARARSIRETARRLSLTSGQVSKIISNLERHFGVKLFKRSVSGVFLTSQGAEIHKLVEELLASGQKIESLLSNQNNKKFSRILAIAGTSFLSTHFTTPIACRMAAQWPSTTFRFLDLAPDQIVPVGLRGGFEMVVHYGPLAWPSTWTSVAVGRSRWVLCARTGHPLLKRPTLKQVLEYAFVVPTYWTSEGLVRGNDQFPVAMSKRRLGFETSTADAAIPILLATDQIAFLPELLIHGFVRAKALREVRTDDLPSVEKELFLSAKSDAVPASIFENLSQSMSRTLLHR